MTTQAELIELAKKYEHDSPAVKTLLTSIYSNKGQADNLLLLLSAKSCSLRRGVELEEGFIVCLENDHLVTAASKACVALSKLAGNYQEMACILECMGEKISY